MLHLLAETPVARRFELAVRRSVVRREAGEQLQLRLKRLAEVLGARIKQALAIEPGRPFGRTHQIRDKIFFAETAVGASRLSRDPPEDEAGHDRRRARPPGRVR